MSHPTIPRKRPPASDLLGLVGWVFADLLLALVVVFIGTQPGDPNAAARAATPTSTTTTTSTTSTTTTTIVPVTTTVPAGVEKQHVCIVLPPAAALRGPDGAAKDDAIAAQLAALNQQLADTGLAGRRAGIVLAFGVSPNSGEGKPIAESSTNLVLPLVHETFGASAARSFWGGAPDTDQPFGTIVLNVYPLSEPGVEPLATMTNDEC